MNKFINANDKVLNEIGINLESIKFVRPTQKRAHYRAAANWLTKYALPSNPSSLQKIRGYLECFYHLTSIDLWREAKKVLQIQIGLQKLHCQLYIWGYYEQQIQIYSQTLGKLDYEWDLICLDGLGKAHDSMGNGSEATDFYEKCRKLALEQGNERAAALANCNLGIDLNDSSSGKLISTAFQIFPTDIRVKTRVHRAHYRAANSYLNHYPPRPNASKLGQVGGLLECCFHLFALDRWEAAQEIINLRIKPNRDRQLCDYLIIWGYLKEVINLSEQLLGKINDQSDASCFLRMGTVYNYMGNFSGSIENLEQSLKIFRDNENRRKEGLVLDQLGIAYRCLGSSKAVDYHHQSLLVAQEINHPLAQGSAFGELGITYTIFEETEKAVQCLNDSLSIIQGDNFKLERTIPLSGLSLFWSNQNNHEKSLSFSEEYLTISREIAYPYGEVDALCGLGEIQFKNNEFHLSLENFKLAIDICRDSAFHSYGAKICKYAGELHRKLGIII